ncbi:hypothetical protein HH311_28655 [Actinomycetospora sp. TBRC 11914]|nr:hypothetical protein [Actinomycetospora sp. TBRC 11914]
MPDGLRRPDAAAPADAEGRAALAVAALLDQDLALARGRVRDAGEVTHAVRHRLEGTGDLAVLRARDAWAADQDAEARRFLGPVLDRTHPCTVTGLATVQAWVLDTEIALARRQMPLARQRMLAALDVAGEQALLRPLLQASPALHHYLAARRGMFGEHEGHVGRVLSGARVQPTAGWVALTDREREVLALLPTTRSAAEIAEDLAVSTNTVKTHQRAIYHKLGAGGRRDAVTLARRAGLLTHSA